MKINKSEFNWYILFYEQSINAKRDAFFFGPLDKYWSLVITKSNLISLIAILATYKNK